MLCVKFLTSTDFNSASNRWFWVKDHRLSEILSKNQLTWKDVRQKQTLGWSAIRSDKHMSVPEKENIIFLSMGENFRQIIQQFAFFIPFLTKCKSPTGKRKNNRADFLLIWTKQKGPWIIEQRVITKVCRSNLCGLGSYLSLIADVHQRSDKM